MGSGSRSWKRLKDASSISGRSMSARKASRPGKRPNSIPDHQQTLELNRYTTEDTPPVSVRVGVPVYLYRSCTSCPPQLHGSCTVVARGVARCMSQVKTSSHHLIWPQFQLGPQNRSFAPGSNLTSTVGLDTFIQ